VPFAEEMSDAATGGGIVDVPAGTFSLPSMPVINVEQISLRGVSTEGSVLMIGGDGLQFANGIDLELVDLTLDGSLLSAGASLLKITGNDVRLRLRRVRIRNAQAGISLHGNAVLDVIMDDLRADLGALGQLQIASKNPSTKSRVRLRQSRLSGGQPIEVNAENVVIADCRFDVSPNGAGIRLSRGCGIRVERTRFKGPGRGGVVIATTGRGVSDIQVVHCVASGGMGAVVRVESTTETFPVFGLWADGCSNSDPSSGEGGILTVIGPGGFEPGDMRVRQPFMASDASPVTLMAGVDVMGVEARRRSGMADEPTRPGGNWLTDSTFGAGTWTLPAGATVTQLKDISLGTVPVLAVPLAAKWATLSKSVPVNPIRMAWFGGENVPYVFSVMVRVKELDVGYPDRMELRTWITAGSSNQVIGGSAKFSSHRLSTVWQRLSCVCYGSARTLFRVHLSLFGDPGLTAYFFAPQFEPGHTPTAFQPREGTKLGPPRQLQAHMVGPMTIGYAESGDIDVAGARLGDRFLNVRPSSESSASDEVDGWIVTAQGLKPMDPLGADQKGCSTEPSALVSSSSMATGPNSEPPLLKRVQDMVRSGLMQEMKEQAIKTSDPAISSTPPVPSANLVGAIASRNV
jgi:hypothetical protein